MDVTIKFSNKTRFEKLGGITIGMLKRQRLMYECFETYIK